LFYYRCSVKAFYFANAKQTLKLKAATFSYFHILQGAGGYEAKPSIEAAARLSNLLEVSLDYLVGNSDIEVNTDMLNRVLELQSLSEEDKNTALKLLDAFLRDANTKKAYS